MIKRITASCALAAALAVLIISRGRAPQSDTQAFSATGGPDAAPAEVVRLAAPSANGGRAAPAAQRPYVAAAPRKFQRRFMFDCSDVRIFVRIGEGEAALLPESSLTGHWIPLTRAGSAWRGRYANENLVFRPDE